MNINESDFRRIDLNLLVVFSALMAERSVSGAARRLLLGQPAVSAALKRLRGLFGDELFVRTGRGMEPTARALQVAERISPSLVTIHEAITRPGEFNPADATRLFRIGTTDAMELVLIPALMKLLQQRAPKFQVVVRDGYKPSGYTEAIDANEIDIAIAPIQHLPRWQRERELFRFTYHAVFDRIRLGVDPPLSLDQFASQPHLLTSAGAELQGFVDGLLQKLNVSRQVILGTSNLGTLPLVLGQTAAIATLPSYTADLFVEQFGLTASPLPFPIDLIPVSLVWPATRDQDPAMQLMIDIIVECARKLDAPVSRIEVATTMVS